MNILKYNKNKIEKLYSIGIIILSIYFYYEVLKPSNVSIWEPNNFITIFDGPSYYDFSFESLQTILSQHRTFGFPLFMKFYRLFDFDLYYWSLFSYLFYIFSILIFFNVGFKFKFNKNFYFFVRINTVEIFLSIYWSVYRILSISLILISLSFL